MTIPTLTDTLTQHRHYGLDCACGRPINSDADWARHVEQVWREVCTVETVEQLDALPVPSVAISVDQRAVYKSLPRPGIQAPSWIQPGSRYEHTADDIPLPILLLWTPDWSDQ